MTLRVLFYVLHLQGIGHVVRASRIAGQLAQDGFEVNLILGGMPIEGFEPGDAKTVQLPPLRMAPDSYRELRKADGSSIDDAYKARRFGLLTETLERTQPHVVMVEAFPFDRPQMHFEIIPFLERARDQTERPVIVSSIRDILQHKSRPERDADARDILATLFDYVLIHGDPRLATLDETFRHAAEFGEMTRYTGIVSPQPVRPLAAPLYDVIVSAGGGATGAAILNSAIMAKPLTRMSDRRWVVALGPHSDGDEARQVRSLAAANGVEVLPFLNDLATHLAGAELSISQAGYNTAADILRSGCRSVLCPYAGIRQNEQSQRAEKFAEHGLATVVAESYLNPETLAKAIDAALTLPPPALEVDLDGVPNTARILRELVSERL